MTTAEIAKYVAGLKRAIQIARMLAALTPTDLDDKVLASIEKVILTLEPFLGEQWVADFVSFLVGFLDKNGDDPIKVIVALRSMAASMQE